MEFHEGGPAGGAVLSGSNVPAFLTKLWTLVEDPETDTLICWSPNGTSFHVFDQGRFSKEVLPKFFKHNNMASFVRQLNMYGFRKVVHIEHGGLVKPERDDTEFQHPFFVKGQEHLLENIKRKVTNVSSVRQEEMKISPEKVSKILTDVQIMRGRQETIDSKIIAMKHENEALWREVASLRQKHVQQQKVVTKLIQFLVSLVQPNRVLGMKRKLPLMLNDSSSAHSIPKYSRQFSLEHLQASPVTPASASVFSADAPLKSGPTISDITELDTHTPLEITSDWTDTGVSSLIRVKEEPSSPEVEEAVDTPRSPTTLINSILQESERHSTHNPSTANLLPDRTSPICSSTADPLPASPVVAVGLSTTEHLSPASSNQSSPCAPAHIPAPSPSRPHQKCLSIACMEKMELSDHVETIDTDLENLQSILNAQTFSFDSSPLLEFFSSSGLSGDFDLDSLDTLLSPETPKAADNSNNSTSTGMQLVQYMVPMQTSEGVNLGEGGADLPTLLELEGESYFNTDPPVEDPTISLLPSSVLRTHTDLETDL